MCDIYLFFMPFSAQQETKRHFNVEVKFHFLIFVLKYFSILQKTRHSFSHTRCLPNTFDFFFLLSHYLVENK